MAHSSTPFAIARSFTPPWPRFILRLLALLTGLFLFSALVAHADSGLYKNFVILRTSAGGTTYYYTYAGIAVPNPAFQNANLGVFDPAATTPELVLDGAEATTYEGNGAVMQAARLFYRVYAEGTAPGRFLPVELTYRYSGIDGNPNNRKWDYTTAGINLVQAAGGIGRFVLEVYFQADVSYAGSVFQNYDSNNAANYRATFTVGQAVQAYTAPTAAEVDNNFRTAVTQTFGNLEANRVTTGLLLDYAFEFANPRIYDGALLEDSTLMEPGLYNDLYKTLYTSRFNTNSAGMRHPSLQDSLCYTAREREVITLSGLLFKYNAIDPQARANGTIQTINEQLWDQYINGVWQNPYQELTTVAISPSTTRYNRTSCSVKLPSSLFLTNMGSQISNVQLNADDGRGYLPIPFDTPVGLTYATTGLKHWLFKVTLTTGQQLFSHSKVYIDNVSNPTVGPAPAAGGGALARGSVKDQTVTVRATQAYLGQTGVADLVISYRDAADPVLRRPLIIAEGFDPGRIVAPEEVEGINTFRSFIVGVDNSNSNALRALISNNPSGYDIVYVNWRNGTDYLQRNAYVLEEVIRWVNAQKQPLGGVIQPNVVLGSSMGGVIARMALGDMDRAGGMAAHQTRLYVSLDAPHQGANVPLGYQAAARHAGRMYIGSGPIGAVVEDVQFFRNGLSPLFTLLLADQPAAKQLLINRINLLDQTANSTYQSFQQELRTTWAYPNPANVRSIAISNGSECGIDQEFAAGSTLLHVYRSFKTRFLTDLIGMVAGAGLGALGAPLPILTPLIIPGSSKLEATLDIKSVADGGGNQVYYGNVRYTKKILWLVPVTVNIANHSYTAPSGLLPLDTYPGSFFPPLTIEQPGGASQDWAFTYDNNFYIQRRFSFIPTTSALDIGQGNTTLAPANYLARYVGGTPPAAPLNSPFANFTTAFNLGGNSQAFDNGNFRLLNNEPHEGLFLRTANWLAEEINGNAAVRTNCSGACANSNYSITGNTLICDASDYQITNLPAGVSVTWSIPGSAGSAFALAPNVPSPGQVRITNQRGSTMTTTLTATISGAGCGTADIVLTKTISNDNPTSFPYFQEACTFYNVAHPSQSGTMSGTTFVHQGCMVYVNLGSVPRTVTLGSGGGKPITWGTNTNSRYPNTLYFQLPLGSGGVPFYFNIDGGSDCGNQSLVVFTYSNNARYAYEAAPNPVGNEVTVKAKKNKDAPDEPKDKKEEQPLEFTVEMYEVSTGTRIMSQKNSNGNLENRLNTSKLRPGLYILHITDDEASYSIKISKE
jgi:hypothetical protein